MSDLRKVVKDLEEELARATRAIEQTIHAVELGEDPPLNALREALGGRYYKRWTRESLIDAVHEWVETYGMPPKAYQWQPSSRAASPEDRERFYAGDWPSLSTIRRYFPRWNDLIVAAGYTPRTGPDDRPGPGEASVKNWPLWEGWRLLRGVRIQQGLTQKQLARQAKCSVSQIALLEAGGSEDPPNPSVRMLLSLADALKVKAGGLLGSPD